MRRIRMAFAASLGLVISGPVVAQSSEATIRIVLPYPAGGVGDTAARMIAESMRAKLNRTVIIENKPGAAGRLGVQSVKDAPSDGSVLLFTPIAPMALFPHVYDNLAYDPARDFQPVSQVGTYDLAMAVGANVPAKNLKELVDWLKAHPDQAAYGTPAAGSLPHFFAVLFARHAGLELRHVVYKGNPQAVSDLIGGHLPMFFTSTQDLVEAHKGGRVRVLATSGRARSAVLPDVPTFTESGYGIRGEGWYGLYAPVKTPAEVVAQLNRAVVEAVRHEEFSKRLTPLGVQPTGTSAQEFSKIQKADSELWGPVIRASGFKPE
ncbi:tripartite tricarboxylate transporter substrate binding protein [Bradyrhizobium sp. sBnM-33]|uniref:Bug family tripartite tricarboxylate transporter substrate binding protein n=1 Tax=Bradyrhizobium sp. sBnM-33 TaxID=2831780 RepID=UPI001BCC2A46|nr:Bug family tripartite tricarboxylate transporter substrate binding protein [Bradyrhizobium sp. sBnM-33]WOH54383.1 Bug family tripartite tricarboxylate transporter substrate binding protein [Bradyrhizobium sp. sBnM-33]